MQKSFEIRTAKPDDYESLKQLWLECFDDTPEAVDNFFSKTVVPENVVATFYNGRAVNAMYLIESEVNIDGKKYNSLYIYAVCTHPLYRGKGIMAKAFAFLDDLVAFRKVGYIFLVPASESLFKMYEKLGFKTGFIYKEEVVSKTDTASVSSNVSVLNYNRYIKLREIFIGDIPFATLKEKGFNSFYFPVGNTVKCFSVNNGYAVLETENGQVTVHELFGDEKSLISSVFELSGKDTVTLRKPTDDGSGVPFGMYRAYGNVPEIKNAFFGIPYGG